MNGAGVGGRLVARRERANGYTSRTYVPTANYGMSQTGSREQRRADLRAAFGAGG